MTTPAPQVLDARQDPDRWLTPGVKGIGSASLLADLGHEIPTALLPSFLTSTLRAPAAALGAIEGISDGLAGAARLAGGALADDPERRRNVAVGGFTAEEAEYRLLSAEVRIGCTYGILLCLSRPLRASYILVDAMGMPDIVASEICGITAAAQRQRLTRARRTVRGTIADRCGLVDAANPCRCGRQIQSGLDAGILDRDDLAFATHPRTDRGLIETGTIERAAELDLVLAMGEAYRSDPTFAAPHEVWERVQAACPDLLA